MEVFKITSSVFYLLILLFKKFTCNGGEIFVFFKVLPLTMSYELFVHYSSGRIVLIYYSSISCAFIF